MKEVELEEITFKPRPYEECPHNFERLFFIPLIEDYGPAVHDARARKCFKCNTVLNEE